MRNPRVRFKIDLYAIEHDPFAIRGRHRRADALQVHHILERERTLLGWRLCEHRGGEQKECCEKTFHKRPSFRLTPTRASSLLGSARLWRVRDSERFRESRTFADLRSSPLSSTQTKFVAAECGDQHAASVRSPRIRRDWPAHAESVRLG